MPTSSLISHSSNPFSYPRNLYPNVCSLPLCLCSCPAPSLLLLLWFASSCFFFFTVGIGRLNLDPVSWNLPLTWENPELCSILSPRVSQRTSVPVAHGNHLLGNASFISFLLFSCLLLSLLLVLLRMTPKFTYNNWILTSACFWGDLEVYFPSYFSICLIYFTYLVSF